MTAVCKACDREMVDGGRCDTSILFVEGNIDRPVTRIPYFQVSVDGQDDCPDCGVAVGEYHHPGCDMEKCRHCKQQLISCDCPAMTWHT